MLEKTGFLTYLGRACAPQMPCLRPSDAVPAPLRCRACAPQMPCLFPPAIGWPVGGQVLLLALARYGPDMDEIVSDLEAPDRADRFEIPQRLGQAFFESSHPLGLAAAELVQVGHASGGRGRAWLA